MQKVLKVEHKILFLMFVSIFIVFYPMLISIYVFLPLFIGAMSYVLIEGLEKKKSSFIFISSIYLINLEVNFSLPLFLMLISTFIFYISVYPYLKHFRRCKFCKALISVLMLDLFYLAALFAFDFIFQTQSIILDKILLYSLVVDMLIVVLV